MRKVLYYLILSLFCIQFAICQSGCDAAMPACPSPEFGLNIPSEGGGNFNAESGPDYGCLTTQPNPIWYYLKVQNGGDLVFNLSQTSEINQEGEGYDVDFIVWGPFDGVACGDQLTTDKIVDCSYSVYSQETIFIPNAQPEQYYMLLITNYENLPGYINFIFNNQASSPGASFDCAIMVDGSSYHECDYDNDGEEIFDLNIIKNDIINDNPSWTLSFYETYAEAEIGGGSQIPMLYTVYASNNPTEIYLRVEVDGELFQIIRIYLNVQGYLTLQPATVPICDVNFDQIYDLNLFQISHHLIDNHSEYTFSYYENYTDVINDNQIPEDDWVNYQLDNLNDTLWVIAVSEFGCVSPPLEIYFTEGVPISLNTTNYPPLEFCNDDSLNLTQIENNITTNVGVQFTYYLTMEAALLAANNITNAHIYEPGNNEGLIYVRLENDGFCPAILEIPYKRYYSPEIYNFPESPVYICLGSEILEFEVSSDVTTATYLWEWEASSQEGNLVNIDQPGIYTLTATGLGGCTTMKQIEVKERSLPTFTQIEITENEIRVFAEYGGEEGGLLEYSLNGVMWQSGNLFSNLVKGETYTIYVRENGCRINQKQVSILEVPNFISPNNDGRNDIWDIRGIHTSPYATIRIFDRYGKTIVNTNFEGGYIWDGKYMGTVLPSGAYFYIIEINDEEIQDFRRYVGNINLKNY